ncbi:MAG: YegS/Rv2252/BmrU family lipid kinase [Clostridia bacterium]|nr:YegS/Rv2252/BmrU family lipid kinase [Clostridia bacterium]
MEKCLFLYNPHSGKEKVAKNEKYITNKLGEKYQVEVIKSAYAGNIGDEIRKRGEEFDLVVVSGGDGTINETVDAVMSLNKKPKIGYIPTGTVNDLAHSLCIPRNIKGAVKNILNGEEFTHDVMKINDKYGIYVCCAGLFTESSYSTNQKAKKKMGKIAYFFHGLKSLFSTPAIEAKITYEDKVIEGNFAMLLVINSRCVAGFKVNKRAVLDDGTVDVVLVESKKKEIVNLGAVARAARMFVTGIPQKDKKKVHALRLKKFKIEMGENHVINLDGEGIAKGSFEFEAIKSGVTLIVPSAKKLSKYDNKI